MDNGFREQMLSGQKIKNTRPYFNKDDNIHKSEALKWYDRRTVTLVDYQN